MKIRYSAEYSVKIQNSVPVPVQTNLNFKIRYPVPVQPNLNLKILYSVPVQPNSNLNIRYPVPVGKPEIRLYPTLAELVIAPNRIFILI